VPRGGDYVAEAIEEVPGALLEVAAEVLLVAAEPGGAVDELGRGGGRQQQQHDERRGARHEA